MGEYGERRVEEWAVGSWSNGCRRCIADVRAIDARHTAAATSIFYLKAYTDALMLLWNCWIIIRKISAISAELHASFYSFVTLRQRRWRRRRQMMTRWWWLQGSTFNDSLSHFMRSPWESLHLPCLLICRRHHQPSSSFFIYLKDTATISELCLFSENLFFC